MEKAIELDPQYVLMIIKAAWFTVAKADSSRANMIIDRHRWQGVDNPKLFGLAPVSKSRAVSAISSGTGTTAATASSRPHRWRMLSTMTRDLRDGREVVVRDNRAASIIARAHREHPG